MNTRELRTMYARVDAASRATAAATSFPWIEVLMLAAVAAATGWFLA